jgi:hypothetical protein
VYAIKIEVDAYWRDEYNATELFDPGRGKIDLYFRGEITNMDGLGHGQGVMHPCGLLFPPSISSASCIAQQLQLPDAMWDQQSIPDYLTTVSTTGFSPADVLTFVKTLGDLGFAASCADVRSTQFLPFQ